MTRLTAILVFIFFVQMSSYGQDGGKNVFRGGGGYVSLGTDVFNMVSLDNSLRRYQLPEFGSGQMIYTIGGGGGSFINRFYFGGYGEAHIGSSTSNELYKNKMNGGQDRFKHSDFKLLKSFLEIIAADLLRLVRGPSHS